MLEALKVHLSELSDNFYTSYQELILMLHMFQYLIATGDSETFTNWLVLHLDY
jgi:hypothetical protein